MVIDVKQVSKGLWKKYGDGRVKDTPITEVCSYITSTLCMVINNSLWSNYLSVFIYLCS